MATVDSLISEPVRCAIDQAETLGTMIPQRILGNVALPEFTVQVKCLLLTGVPVASLPPLTGNSCLIGDEMAEVAPPHFGSGVVLPAVLGIGQGLEDLKVFNPLLA